MKTFLVQYSDIFNGPSKRWVEIEAPSLKDAENIAIWRAWYRVGIKVNRIVEI